MVPEKDFYRMALRRAERPKNKLQQGAKERQQNLNFALLFLTLLHRNKGPREVSTVYKLHCFWMTYSFNLINV